MESTDHQNPVCSNGAAFSLPAELAIPDLRLRTREGQLGVGSGLETFLSSITTAVRKLDPTARGHC